MAALAPWLAAARCPLPAWAALLGGVLIAARRERRPAAERLAAWHSPTQPGAVARWLARTLAPPP